MFLLTNKKAFMIKLTNQDSGLEERLDAELLNRINSTGRTVVAIVAFQASKLSFQVLYLSIGLYAISDVGYYSLALLNLVKIAVNSVQWTSDVVSCKN